MMENKKDKEKQLDAILSEINEGIKTEGGEVVKEKRATSKPKATEKNDGETTEKPEKAVKKAKTGEGKPKPVKDTTPKPPKPKKEVKEKKEPVKKLSYDGEDQMSFAKAATIIEDAMDYQDDADDATDDTQNDDTADSEAAQHAHHIAVTHGETVEVPEEEKKPIQETEKSVRRLSKAELKKANGTAVSRPVKERPTLKQRRTMVLGIILSFFVIIGLFSTILGTVNLIGGFVNATSLKNELARVVFPLVIIDTPEFDTPTKLDNSAMISSAIWAFVIDDSDKSKYKTDDLGSIFVPDTDIELYVRQMFGTEVKISHQTVDDAGIQMSYSPETKTYIIEATPRSLPYTPRVDSVKKTGDIYTIEVGYILPTVLWNLDQDISKSIPDKIMEYKLLKKGDTYQITSVKFISIASVPEGTKQESDPFLEREEVPGEGIVGEGDVLSSEVIPEGDAAAAAVPSDSAASGEPTSSEAESKAE